VGAAVWFREDGEPSENEVAWQYTEFALRLLGVSRSPDGPACGSDAAHDRPLRHEVEAGGRHSLSGLPTSRRVIA
jgi:hypothetical protein